jgi:hypothetical protein
MRPSNLVGLLTARGDEDWIAKSMTGQILGTYEVESEATMDIPQGVERESEHSNLVGGLHLR